jgi:23S rRNA G2445 N2-methylase RlmL
MLRRELAAAGDIEVTGTGFDGRSDLVFFQADRAGRTGALASRLAEDVFAEIGQASRAGAAGPATVAAAIWQPADAERVLSVWAQEVRPLAGTMTFRVIARVLSERAFLRTDLRQAFAAVIARHRPRWRLGDPAQLEFWISEWHDGQYAAGLRLTDASMRQHGGRAAERSGALRPTVAAAMVALAGPPRGTLLDPCCGSGTILAEALTAGWTADGTDIDAGAIGVARRNAPGAHVDLGDARELLLPDSSVAACVSNLPFGRQFQVTGTRPDWIAAVLLEISRVTRRTPPAGHPGGTAAASAGTRAPARHARHDLGVPPQLSRLSAEC